MENMGDLMVLYIPLAHWTKLRKFRVWGIGMQKCWPASFNWRAVELSLMIKGASTGSSWTMNWCSSTLMSLSFGFVGVCVCVHACVRACVCASGGVGDVGWWRL